MYCTYSIMCFTKDQRNLNSVADMPQRMNLRPSGESKAARTGRSYSTWYSTIILRRCRRTPCAMKIALCLEVSVPEAVTHYLILDDHLLQIIDHLYCTPYDVTVNDHRRPRSLLLLTQPCSLSHIPRANAPIYQPKGQLAPYLHTFLVPHIRLEHSAAFIPSERGSRLPLSTPRITDIDQPEYSNPRVTLSHHENDGNISPHTKT
jgi:hypothetical protein